VRWKVCAVGHAAFTLSPAETLRPSCQLCLSRCKVWRDEESHCRDDEGPSFDMLGTRAVLHYIKLQLLEYICIRLLLRHTRAFGQSFSSSGCPRFTSNMSECPSFSVPLPGWSLGIYCHMQKARRAQKAEKQFLLERH